jgi:glutaredoxin
MNSSITLACSALLLILASPLSLAITVVECVDADGNSSFRDKCPVGMAIKGTKKLPGKRANVDASPTAQDAMREFPVVLFTTPDCEACELVRDQLDGRDVAYTEKDATTDRVIQGELAAVTGGALTVPTVTVGTQKFTGYSRNDLKSALTEAGYP